MSRYSHHRSTQTTRSILKLSAYILCQSWNWLDRTTIYWKL